MSFELENYEHWSDESLPLITNPETVFKPEKPAVILALKTAALIESQAGEESTRPFLDLVPEESENPKLRERAQRVLVRWGQDEGRHGDVFKALVGRLDPQFPFDAAYQRLLDINSKEGSLPDKKTSLDYEVSKHILLEIYTARFYEQLSQMAQNPLVQDCLGDVAKDEKMHFRTFLMLRKTIDESRTGKRLQQLYKASDQINFIWVTKYLGHLSADYRAARKVIAEFS